MTAAAAVAAAAAATAVGRLSMMGLDRHATLRSRLRELRTLADEVEVLVHRGKRLAQQHSETEALRDADIDALCSYAARLRTQPPTGFPLKESGMPVRQLPPGFWLPHPTLADQIPKAHGLWRASKRAPPPQVEVLPLAGAEAGLLPIGSVKDMPGLYFISSVAGVRCAASADSELVGTIAAGTEVKILEVSTLGKRVRGRVERPDGWISLQNLETGHRWAEKLGTHLVRLQAVPPATALFYTRDGTLPRPKAASSRCVASGTVVRVQPGCKIYTAAFAEKMSASDTVTFVAPRLSTAKVGTEPIVTTTADVPKSAPSDAPGGEHSGKQEQSTRRSATAARSREVAALPKAKSKADFKGSLVFGADDSDDEDGSSENP